MVHSAPEELPPFHGVPLPIKDLVHVAGWPTTYGSLATDISMTPIAHAEDGGGSIRIPASCTGLVGLKPTRGLVTNAVVEVEGFATSGVVSRTLADTAADAHAVARRRSEYRSTDWHADRRPHHVADRRPPGRPGLPGRGRQNSSRAGRHHLVDKSLPRPTSDELISTFMKVWNVASAGVPLVDPDRVEPHNRAQREAAKAVDSWTYAKSVHQTQVTPAACRSVSSWWPRRGGKTCCCRSPAPWSRRCPGRTGGRR
ncbi:predicted protein [Streptomyces sp. AA4]|nr:predicted protein [Streptomyces sp. AA4]